MLTGLHATVLLGKAQTVVRPVDDQLPGSLTVRYVIGSTGRMVAGRHRRWSQPGCICLLTKRWQKPKLGEIFTQQFAM